MEQRLRCMVEQKLHCEPRLSEKFTDQRPALFR